MSRTGRKKQQNVSTTPNATVEVVAPPNVSEPITVLTALYQGEKTDASSVFNTAMAMMGIAVAYLVGAIPFVGSLSKEPTAKLFLILLPFPLWLIVAFHSLMTLNAMTHGISVRIIEDALFAASGLSQSMRDLVGSAAGDKVMDITQSKLAHKITTAVVYTGVAFLVIGFTVYSLHAASNVAKDDVVLADMPLVTIAEIAYSLLFIMVMWSWIAGFRMINKGRDTIVNNSRD